MKPLALAFTLCSSVSLVAALVALRAGLDSEPTAAAAHAPAGDVTGSLPCKKIVVEVDEGYGVGVHETRYDCAPRD